MFKKSKLDKYFNQNTLVRNEQTGLYELKSEFKNMKLGTFKNNFEDTVTDGSANEMISENVTLKLAKTYSLLNNVFLKERIVDLEGTTGDSVKYEFDGPVGSMQLAYGNYQNQNRYQYTSGFINKEQHDRLGLLTNEILIDTFKATYAVTNNLLEDTFYNVFEKIQNTIVKQYLNTIDEYYYRGRSGLGVALLKGSKDSEVSDQYNLNNFAIKENKLNTTTLLSMLEKINTTGQDTSDYTFHVNNTTYFRIMKNPDFRNVSAYGSDDINKTGKLRSILGAKLFVSESANKNIIPSGQLDLGSNSGEAGDLGLQSNEDIVYLTNDKYAVLGIKRELQTDYEDSVLDGCTYVVATTRFGVSILPNSTLIKYCKREYLPLSYSVVVGAFEKLSFGQKDSEE